jgi:hypothetical protein
MNLTFLAPDGLAVPEADLSFVAQQIEKQPDSYWEYQTGMASLLDVENSSPQLTFTARHSLGVLVRYCTEDGADELVLTNPTSTSSGDEVAIYFGGDEWVVPGRYFVSKNLALQAIAEFWRSGRMLRGQNWVVLGME